MLLFLLLLVLPVCRFRKLFVVVLHMYIHEHHFERSTLALTTKWLAILFVEDSYTERKLDCRCSTRMRWGTVVEDHLPTLLDKFSSPWNEVGVFHDGHSTSGSWFQATTFYSLFGEVFFVSLGNYAGEKNYLYRLGAQTKFVERLPTSGWISRLLPKEFCKIMASAVGGDAADVCSILYLILCTLHLNIQSWHLVSLQECISCMGSKVKTTWVNSSQCVWQARVLYCIGGCQLGRVRLATRTGMACLDPAPMVPGPDPAHVWLLMSWLGSE